MNSLGYLKSAVREFYDSENKTTLEVGRTGKKLEGKRYYIISQLFKLLFETDYINDETKMILLEYHMRLCDVQSEIFRLKGLKIAYTTAMNKVYSCIRKIDNKLGKNLIVDVIDFTTRDIDIYYDRVNCELSKYKKDYILDVYDLELKDILPSSKEVSLERLDKTCVELKPYLKSVKSKLLENIDVEAIAYIKYLYSLDREVDSRKDMIDTLVKGE